MFKLTPVTSKIGQGHPSSNLTKTLLRYIHGISFGSMRLIFVELSCLQAKCWRTDGRTDRQTDGRTDGRTDRQTDGQTNLIVGLVTRNPPKNYTAHPHDMVHVPAKFRENTSMRFWVTVRKLNVTDRRTDGRRCNISRGAEGPGQRDRQTGGVAISPVPGLRRGVR